MSLFAELKRRNVFRVAIAYLISAWVVAQVSDLVLSGIQAPSWVMKVLLLVMGLGFIAALIISWAYEITPEGIKREVDVTKDDSITNLTAKKLDTITIAAVVVLVLLLVADRFYSTAQIPPETIRITEQGGNSIAVLPFIDMSEKGNEGYFADGISEEILNVLVRIPKLKVAGRTSSFSFKDRNEDLRKISDLLGVNHILEGSVRRSGSKLRITAQLIRGKDGFHLWSETYDREAADIFKIQDEIARAVAKQLALSLGLSSNSLVKDRTDDIVAYEKYLHSKQLFLARGTENIEQALVLLNEVVARDPNFTPAWALTASVYGIYESYQSEQKGLKHYKLWRSAGVAAANRAIALDPNNAPAYASKGILLTYEYQWVEAFKNFDKALALSSDDNDVLDGIAQSMLGVGYFDEALVLSKIASNNDPLVAIYRNTLGREYSFLGNNKEAIIQFRDMIRINPKMRFSYNNLAWIYINQHQLDEAIASTTLAVKNKAVGQDSLNQLILLRDNKNNVSELRKLAIKTNDPGFSEVIAITVNDLDTYLAGLQEIWSKEYRSDPDIFTGAFGNRLFQSPIWKAQVRKDGILKLWRSRGFPPQCRPLPDSNTKDDFECVVNKKSFE